MVQRREEVALDQAVVFTTDVAVGIQPQLATIGHQQHVPAALPARSGGFEQQRVTLRGEPVQRQQVGGGVQGFYEHRWPGVVWGGDSFSPWEKGG